MDRRSRGGGSTNQILTVNDVLNMHKYSNMPYKRHSPNEPRLIHLPGGFNADGVFQAPDDAATHWPIGEVASFHGDTYPDLVTRSKRTKIDIDDTDVASGKELAYLNNVSAATLIGLTLDALRQGQDTSRICKEVVRDGIARRFKPLDFLLSRIGEYPNYKLLRDACLHWTQLVGERPNGPLMGFQFVNDGLIAATTDYDLSDIDVVDAYLAAGHAALDAIDADSDQVKVRIALEVLAPGTAQIGPISSAAPTIDVARWDVWMQKGLRRDDPDVSDRTAQFPNLEVDGTEKVPVYVRYDKGGLLAPDPYLFSLFRPTITYDHDNYGDDAGSYGAFSNYVDGDISNQYESAASYYKLNGDHVVERFNYNEDGDDPVGLTSVFPHFLHGTRAMLDSASTVDAMSGSFKPYVKFEVPITHFGEVTLAQLEQTTGRTASFKS